MVEEGSERERLERELRELKRELQGLERSVPPHSVRPDILIRIEEVEERVAEVEAKLRELGEGDKG